MRNSRDFSLVQKTVEKNSFSLSANTYSSEGGTAITELNDAVGLANLTSSQKTKYNSIVYGAIASGTQISDDDKETLKSIAVSSADADAKARQQSFTGHHLIKHMIYLMKRKRRLRKIRFRFDSFR